MSEIDHDRCLKRIKEMCIKHRDTVFFYGDVKNNVWFIEENGILPTKLHNIDCNLLKELYEGDYIAQEDKTKFDIFYTRIVLGTQRALRKEEMSITFLCETALKKKELVRIVCFFNQDDNGKIIEITGKFRPLIEQERINDKIISQFTSDMNPTLFFDRVDSLIEKYNNLLFAFIQMDVDKFKLINDKYGSDKGDEVLKGIYETLRIMCSDRQAFTRMSSDEFMIITPFTTKEELVNYIHELDSKIRNSSDIYFKLTYGVSVASEHKKTVRSYCDEAGIARNSIKGNVMEYIAFYTDKLKNNMKSKNDIEQIEEEALNREEFIMYLQPKYYFEDVEPTIVGAEALVRWNSPEKGLISPSEFIPVFEENGFILKVDEYIWESACKVLARWISEGKKPIPISINISRTYLKNLDIVKYIMDLLKKYDLPINLLQLEITETKENEETSEFVTEFKKAGFKMLMDDFGSGYSSLNMLKNTKFDVLKIDRVFLSEFLESNRGKSIVSHVISMSDELGLDTIAEGVETKEQAMFLHDNGCNVAQGFYFSKPLPVDEFEKIAFGS